MRLSEYTDCTLRVLMYCAERSERLVTIAGTVPELADLPQGCPFAGRCPRTIAACHAALPAAVDLGAGHMARCIRPGDGA